MLFEYPYNPDGDNIFQFGFNDVKFGPGVLGELGAEAKALGMTRVAAFVDKNVIDTAPVQRGIDSLKSAGLDYEIFTDIANEPAEETFESAAEFVSKGKFNGVVSIGGGSTMDTAKAGALYGTYPAPLLRYISKPYGDYAPIPGPLMPHIACPTTAGTGSEVTSVSVLALDRVGAKSAIADRKLRPSKALVDPTTVESAPAGVVASSGFDALCHALEAVTARSFASRPLPEDVVNRALFCRGNPFSDALGLLAISLVGKNIERAVKDNDKYARHQLMLASVTAGMAFGNAGTHLLHAMSYAVAGLKHDFVAKGYEKARRVTPHGIAVVINGPAVFRFSGPAAPEKHLAAAQALGADITGVSMEKAGDALADRMIALMKSCGLPSGTAELGFTEDDCQAMAEVGMKNPRIIGICPRDCTEADMAAMFKDTLRYW